MNLENLETFVVLTKTMSFSKTADVMFLSQSTVTTRIKALEDELKTELFIRKGKIEQLTPKGVFFLGQATKILDLVESSKKSIFIFDQFTGHLSVSAPESVWKFYLHNVINRFVEKYPSTALTLKSRRSEFVIRDLLEEKADIGVIFNKLHNDEMEVISYFNSTFHLVGAPSLVDKNAYITPENIYNYPTIFIDWAPEFVAWYNRYYKNQMHFYEVDGVSLYINLLLNGNGIGFLPDRMAQDYFKSNQLIDLEYKYMEEAPVDQAYIVFPKKKYKKISFFLDLLLESLR